MTGQEDVDLSSHPKPGIANRFAGFFHQRHKREEKPRLIHVIANPAAGQNEQPLLKTLNSIFKSADIDWQIFVTKKTGDGQRLAREAVTAGADMVAVYGGDGTVTDVASGLVGSSIPLGVLPGGTANMMSRAYGIPQDLDSAVALIASHDHAVYPIHIGQIDDHYFLQLVGIGMEAKIVEGADRAAKDRLGILAYTLAGLRALTDPQTARYHLSLDGNRSEEDEGVTCLVAIIGNLGIPSLENSPTTADPGSGLMDIAILRQANLGSLVSLANTVVSGNENPDVIHHWQAREVNIQVDPDEGVQADGEFLGKTPVTINVLQEPISLIVPSETVEKKQKGAA